MTTEGVTFELSQFVVSQNLVLPEGGPILLDKMTYGEGHVRFGEG